MAENTSVNKTEKKNYKLPLLEENDESIEALLKAGVHFGHKTQRWNSLMKDYIYTSREGVHIIDLIKTINGLNRALEVVADLASKGDVLFVGTKPQAREAVKKAAIKTKSHFIINRWPGGLLTNYNVTRKSIKKLNDMVKMFKEGIENRTKKEMLSMEKELERLEFLYGGTKNLNKKPSCVIVVDPKKSRIAVREAHKMGVPVIAMVDTNASPRNVDYVIPSNDDAINSIEFIINRLADAVLEGNEGRGEEYEEIDFDEIRDIINNMAKVIEENKKSRVHGRAGAPQKSGGPKVVRVSREQAKKFHKAFEGQKGRGGKK